MREEFCWYLTGLKKFNVTVFAKVFLENCMIAAFVIY